MTYYNNILIVIPSVIIQVKSKKLSLVITQTYNKIIKDELKIILKYIENISNIKLNTFHFNDYIYKFIKFQNISLKNYQFYFFH